MSATELVSGFACAHCPQVFPSKRSRAQHRRITHPVADDATEKMCIDCGVVKPLTDFNYESRALRKIAGECRQCNNAAQTARRAASDDTRSRTVPRINESPLADWKAEAACRGLDPALWYPENGETAAEAIRVCKTCPVVEKCRAEAVANHEQGVWGASTERDRRRMRRSRRWAS